MTIADAREDLKNKIYAITAPLLCDLNSIETPTPLLIPTKERQSMLQNNPATVAAINTFLEEAHRLGLLTNKARIENTQAIPPDKTWLRPPRPFT